MQRIRNKRLPSPAMVVACIAMLLSLGGTSYAAIVLPANSVGTKQLKLRAVSGSKVKPDTLTGVQINERQLVDVRSALSARRAPISRVIYVRSGFLMRYPGITLWGTACPAGMAVVGGGAEVSPPESAAVIDSYPGFTAQWVARARAESPGATLTVYAICADAAALYAPPG